MQKTGTSSGGLPAISSRLILLVLVAIGSWFRLHNLGAPAFRADTILLWGLANRPVPVFDVLTRWFEVSGAAGQMPMPAFIMKLFLALTPGDPTPFMVRLPFALLGIAAIPMAYLAGRFMVDRRFGLLMAAFVAVNPFHVFFSREAYFYSALFLGYFIYLRAIAGMLGYIWKNEAPPVREYGIMAAALFFCGYSQMSGLLLCAVGFIYLVIELLRRQKSMPALPVFGKIIGVHALVFFPFLFTEWGPREMVVQFLNESKTEYNKQVVALSGENVVTGIAKAMSGFSWGTTVWGWSLLVVSLGLAVTSVIKRFRRYAVFVVVFIILQILLFIVVRSTLGALYESRYLSGTFPFWLFLLAAGWCWLATSGKWKPAVAAAIMAIPVAAWVYPSYLITRLTGNPTPYYEIVETCDSLLSPGAPVLIDRWFEPWNEMRSHPGTNAVYMFTVPNEPLQAYLQNNWRARSEEFLRNNPDAAYLEIAKTYQDVASVGPWNWPHAYFARRVTIANDAGVKLMKLGLAGRGGYYTSNTNRLVVELFYNTREDFIAKLKAEGKKTHAFFGAGWTFRKSGPMGLGPVDYQTQDFREWRVMGDRANIEIVNLGDAEIEVALRILALSPAGPKRVVAAGGRSREFSGSRMQGWELGPFTVKPGSYILTLEDVLKDRAQYPLLVSSIEAVAGE